MSKKVISILLSGAMLVSMFCVGFGALTASAADDTSTFYFLAPRTEKVNYFAENDEVGYWFWMGMPEGSAWPGPAADKAEEIGKDVYKVTIPDTATGLIFNASVDAGEDDGNGNYADPAKAAVAFQTVDITDIEVYPGNDHRNEIYVLDLDTTTEGGKPKTSGNWYSTDASSDNYYRLSDAYKAYKIENDTATPDVPGKDSDTTSSKNETTTGDKKYSSGSSVTVTYKVGGINDLGSISSVITYNADVLELDTTAYTDKRGNGVWYEKGEVKPNVAINSTDAGVEIGVLTEDGEFGSDFTDSTTLVTVAFKAKADFNEDDLGIALNTTKFMEVTENGSVDITDKAGDYVSIDVTLPEAKPIEKDTDTSSKTESTVSTNSTTSTTTSEKATDSDKKETKDPSSDSSKTTSSSTTSTSTTTTGTTSTVQTAGTFAVLSLVVILMAAAGVVIYTRKKTEE